MRSARGVCLIVGLLAIHLGLVGCPIVWQRVTINDPIKPENVTFIMPGKTTFAEILERLGAPNEMSESHLGPVARYRFLDEKYFRVNFGWALRFINPFLSPDMSLGGGGIGTDEFQVVFDSNWIVQWYAFASASEAARFTYWPF